MKVVASIFTWIEFVAATIISFFYLLAISGVVVFSGIDEGQIESAAGAAVILWIIWSIAFVIRLVICIWRQKAAEEGNKTACGVCTLLFVSLLGGIFTLCIPNEKTYTSGSYRAKITTPTKTYTKDEAIIKTAANKILLERGIINREEYDKRQRDIEKNTH